MLVLESCWCTCAPTKVSFFLMCGDKTLTIDNLIRRRKVVVN